MHLESQYLLLCVIKWCPSYGLLRKPGLCMKLRVLAASLAEETALESSALQRETAGRPSLVWSLTQLPFATDLNLGAGLVKNGGPQRDMSASDSQFLPKFCPLPVGRVLRPAVYSGILQELVARCG